MARKSGGSEAIRWIIGIGSIVIGLSCLFMSWGPLSNLFEDYQDSPATTYLLFGGIEIAIGLVFIVAGIFALRDVIE